MPCDHRPSYLILRSTFVLPLLTSTYIFLNESSFAKKFISQADLRPRTKEQKKHFLCFFALEIMHVVHSSLCVYKYKSLHDSLGRSMHVDYYSCSSTTHMHLFG